MTIVERHIREAVKRGAQRVLVSGAAVPSGSFAVPVEAFDGEAREHVERVDGSCVAGVAVTDGKSAARAERALMQTCRRPYDGPADRYVVRGVSLPVTRMLTRLPVTPNHVTLANIAVGVGACACAAVGMFHAAGALMFFQLVLDSCDGELARVRHMHSQLGLWLDNVSDDIIDAAFIAALGIGLGGVYVWIGVAALLLRWFSAIVVYIGAARAGAPGDVMAFQWWFERSSKPLNLADRYVHRKGLAVRLRAFGRRDLYGLTYAVTCVVGLPQVAFALGAVLGGVYAVLAAIHLTITRGRP